MIMSENLNELIAASVKAQAEIEAAPKEVLNPHFGHKYANLSAVWNSCKGPLTKNGLTVWQDVVATETGVSVTTRISHISGQWLEFGPLAVPTFKYDAQGIGSAISYARRYSLSAALSIVTDDADDDGEGAKKQPGPRGAPPKEPQPKDVISEPQVKLLYVMSNKHGVTPAQAKDFLGSMGYEHAKEIKKPDFNKVLEWIKSHPEKKAEESATPPDERHSGEEG